MKHHTTRHFEACLIAATAMLSCLPAARSADVTGLRCEYRDNPLGIDAAKPRLSWVIENQKSKIKNPQSEIPRGQKQTAYQVLVASSPELLAKDRGDLWDSGKVASDQSIQVEYGGTPLASRQQCFWKVRVWTGSSGFRIQGSGFRADSQPRNATSATGNPESHNAKGNAKTPGSEANALRPERSADRVVSPLNPGERSECLTPSIWSSPAHWSMGLFHADDWQAKWIKQDPWIFGTLGIDRCAWIWFPPAGKNVEMPATPAYFRARLKLPTDSALRRASVMMCADNDFVLFVNGKEVLKGFSWNAPEKADLTAFLKAGDNVFAVVAGVLESKLGVCRRGCRLRDPGQCTSGDSGR